MTKNFRIAGLVLGSIFAATALTAANDVGAQSAPQTLNNMVTGQCYDAQLVRNTLDAQSQYALISGYSTTDTRPKNIFTSNSNGSLGYHVVRGEGNVAGQLCISAKLTGIMVNSNANLSEPTWARIGPANSQHNQWLSLQQRQSNAKVLLGATSLVQNAQGQEVRGAFLMVTLTDAPRGSTTIFNGAAVTAITGNGNATNFADLVNVEQIQPTFANFANRNIQVASLNR